MRLSARVSLLAYIAWMTLWASTVDANAVCDVDKSIFIAAGEQQFFGCPHNEGQQAVIQFVRIENPEGQYVSVEIAGGDDNCANAKAGKAFTPFKNNLVDTTNKTTITVWGAPAYLTQDNCMVVQCKNPDGAPCTTLEVTYQVFDHGRPTCPGQKPDSDAGEAVAYPPSYNETIPSGTNCEYRIHANSSVGTEIAFTYNLGKAQLQVCSGDSWCESLSRSRLATFSSAGTNIVTGDPGEDITIFYNSEGVDLTGGGFLIATREKSGHLRR